MANLFRTLLLRSAKSENNAGTVTAENPFASARFTDLPDGPQGSAWASEGESNAEEEHAEFWRSFCFRPGENFHDFVQTNGITRMIAWLDGQGAEPEPKALIRLILDMTRRGLDFWEIPGISLYTQGWRSTGGRPSAESEAALSVFAQITGKPVKVYCQPAPDAPMQVLHFTP